MKKHVMRLTYIGLLGLCLLLIVSACGNVSHAQVLTPTVTVKATPTPRPTPTPIPTPTPTPKPVPRIDIPVHIRIPSIGVDADIEPVGVLASGRLDTPQVNPWDSTGWYQSGARPGEQGSAVIDGHVDRPGGGPAVFWNLQYMKPGDEVIVTTRSGQQLHFRTTRRVALPPDDSVLQGVFGDSSGKYLNLITCAGYWIPSEGQTSLRMLVFTQLV